MTDAAAAAGAGGGFVDLHMHSTASDGSRSPAEVVAAAIAAGVRAIALTDHDTIAGVPEAVAAGESLAVRVVAGCEFSTAAPWGEIHVLGYFLPLGHDGLDAFLHRCREDRVRRARLMVEGLQAWGVDVSYGDVLAEAGNAAVGRPHVARALVRRGKVGGIEEAFQQWLGRGRPAYVEKNLPAFREVADLVHSVGGLVSVAHLKDRATRASLTAFKADGLDGVEVRHPGHSPDTRDRIAALAGALGLLRTGGSDWHGEPDGEGGHAMLGSQEVPPEWLALMDQAIRERRGEA